MSRWLPSCFWVLGALTSTAAAAPRLVVDAPAFAFGTIERGTRVDHVFKVRNEGATPAAVLGIDRTCACTIGSANTTHVAPGQELWVSVSLDTRELGGPVAKVVTVRTNDPQATVLRLVLQGTVLTDLVTEPETLYLGEVRRGMPAPRTATVRAGRPTGTARVTAAQARGPFVVPTLEDDGSGGQRVTLRIADGAPSGRFRDEIELRATGTIPTLVLPVFGVVRAEVDVRPSFVRLRGDGGDTEAVVQVMNRGAGPVEIREVLVPGDVATFELETVRRGYEYELRVVLRPALAPREIDDRIQIVTDHPTEGRIDVPLHVVTARMSGRE
jgi:hypothetical protein